MKDRSTSALYCDVIGTMLDHLQSDDLFTPQIETKICLLLHQSLQETFDRTASRGEVDDLLARLEARVRRCASLVDANVSRACLNLSAWDPTGDE